ncbi:MAG: BON domain-containing protein [Acidobacteria bacterium]|nr:BON domain-containing protein [Acidobacteriota bacterium]MCI0666114.1 BON domain-containing protein [Acidobacteriota bacterium]
MKKMLSLISGLVLFTALCLTAGAQVDTVKKAGAKTADTTKKAAEKTADTTKKAAEKTADATKSAAQEVKKTVAPKTDAEILKCTTDAFAASAKLKGLNLTATVANGEATLAGDGKSSGNKNAAASAAKKCGAKKVTNNITIPAPPPPPPKPTEKKPEPAKKP